jgi:formamidopyrimidine-DNA glycosylase
MPELPEVETIITRLKQGTPSHPPLEGHVIQSVQVTWARSVSKPDPESLQKVLIGQQVVDVRRRGKFLHFPLSLGHFIAHLRMSGDMRMEPRMDSAGETLPLEAYDRVVLSFEAPWRLAFSNIRKFGRVWYVNDSQEVFGDLGPEPLSDSFSADQLFMLLQRHNRQIKPLLMDQHFIAGLGNIYTDESLFRAKIHPLRRSNTLSKPEAGRLYTAIRETLQEGIRRNGASLDWVYRGGDFQNYFQVYQRTGEICPNCGTLIQKTLVGQRGTHYCPVCQKAPDISNNG